MKKCRRCVRDAHGKNRRREIARKTTRMTGGRKRRVFPVGSRRGVRTVRAMKKISGVLAALALPFCFSGCDRNEVTSSETVPGGQPAVEQFSAPVAVPEGALGSHPQAALSDGETAKFEAWCKRYGLDPKDTAMLDADPDRSEERRVGKEC